MRSSPSLAGGDNADLHVRIDEYLRARRVISEMTERRRESVSENLGRAMGTIDSAWRCIGRSEERLGKVSESH